VSRTDKRTELLYQYRHKENLASKILCIFVTGGAYAPYTPCLSTPLEWSGSVFLLYFWRSLRASGHSVTPRPWSWRYRRATRTSHRAIRNLQFL